MGSLRRSLGTFWDRLGSLWRSRVSLLGACGSSGLFLVSFWYFFVLFGKPPALFGHPLGSSGVSLAFSCRPFGCLWLVWAVFGIFLLFFCDKGPQGGDSQPSFVFFVCFLCLGRCFFHVFPCVFSPGNVVEAAPQARPKTTAVSSTALRPLLCSPSSF